jgi:hypothetical protein
MHSLIAANQRELRFESAALLFALLSVFGPKASMAGEYKLIEGEGKPVCEAYRNNLEPRSDSRPMACDRQYDPSIQGFSSPEWRELDLSTHFELYRNAWIYMQEHNDSPQGMKLSNDQVRRFASSRLQRRANSKNVHLYAAQPDLVHDGKLRKVLAVREDGCGPDQIPGTHITRLFVLDPSGETSSRRYPKYGTATTTLPRSCFAGGRT